MARPGRRRHAAAHAVGEGGVRKHSRAIQERRREIRARNAPEAEMDALFREERAWDDEAARLAKYAGQVGAFEGASYEPRGLYRPEIDCIMFTRDRVGFCRVCQRAIARIIDLYRGDRGQLIPGSLVLVTERTEGTGGDRRRHESTRG